MSISLLSDGEGAIALCQGVMRSVGVRFNPAGAGPHVSTVAREIRTITFKDKEVINTLSSSVVNVLSTVRNALGQLSAY